MRFRLTEQEINKKKLYDKTQSILNRIKRFDKKLDSSVLDQLKDIRKTVIAEISTAEQFNVAFLTNLKTMINGHIRDFERRFQNLVVNRQEEAWGLGKELSEQPVVTAGVDFALPELSDNLLRITQQYTVEEITGFTNEMMRDINNVINRQVLMNRGANETAKLIDKEVFKLKEQKGITYKAESLARTQVSTVMNLSSEARLEQMREVLPELKKQWVTTIDNRTRQSHKDANGQVVGVDQDFTIDGEKAAFPNDPRLSPQNRYNCRCRVVPFIEKEEV